MRPAKLLQIHTYLWNVSDGTLPNLDMLEIRRVGSMGQKVHKTAILA
jgi:hypothetical protein